MRREKKDTIATRGPLRAVCESIFLGKQSLLVSCDVTQITTFAAAARSWSLYASIFFQIISIVDKSLYK